jgi:signal transduction histidine kinase
MALAFSGELPSRDRVRGLKKSAGISPAARRSGAESAAVGAALSKEIAGGLPADPRDRMIAVFGHDLRGLLHALTLNAELLVRCQGDVAAESARIVRRTIDRMDRLIAGLLDFVRLGAGRLEVHPRPFDATPLLRDVVDIFRPLAGSKSLALTLAVPAAPLRVTADSERMFQVISNLLTNAIEFSSMRGRISIEGAVSGEDVQISVADDGPGIPAGDLERVFEGFYQVRASGSRGLGLGLSIARAIVDAHGGKLWVTSQPGVGSTFYVRIPGPRPERSAGGPPTTLDRAHSA